MFTTERVLSETKIIRQVRKIRIRINIQGETPNFLYQESLIRVESSLEGKTTFPSWCFVFDLLVYFSRS